MTTKNEAVKITKAKFLAYVRVQESGVTNMFDVRTVESYSGLDRVEILDIMKNYGEYNLKFLPDAQ